MMNSAARLRRALFLLLLSCVLTLTLGLYKECPAVKGRTDVSYLYLSYSWHPLSKSDIYSEEFSDYGGKYEEGIFCDPVLYYSDKSAMSATYLNVDENIPWTFISPNITMLNITKLQRENDLLINRSFLEGFSYLQSLSLRGGIIKELPTGFFEGFDHLNILDLSANGITSLPKEILHPLHNLMIFVFHYNMLSEYNFDLFCNLPSLFSINMNDAFYIEEFPVALFSSKGISDRNKEVCKGNMSLPNIKIVRLSRNTFRTLPDYAFDRLGAMDNELEICSGGIHTIQPNAFSGLSKLKYLYLNSNLLSNISMVLNPLTGLEEIDIANNSLSYLTADYFRNNPLLALHAYKNKIKELNGNWNSLSRLIYLDISENQLSKIRHGTFSNSPSLRFLNLGENKISTIESNAFEGMAKVAYLKLNLSHNYLEVLPDSIFRDIPILTHLYLNNNRITSLPGHIFDENRHLQVLFLQHNKLTELDKNIFTQISNLLNLDISNNNISVFDVNLFQKLSFLIRLSLSNNRMKHFETKSIGLDSLKQLFIDGNNLTYLNGNFLQDRTGVITKISLFSNPWNCTCDLFSLVNWAKLNARKVYYFNQTRCSSPSEESFQSVLLDHCNKGQMPLWKILSMVICPCAALLAVTFLLLYFRKSVEIFIFIRFNIRLSTPPLLTESEQAKMKYDAFVSFNQKDLQFVKKELMQKLEVVGEPRFKLCVHHRDFEIGLPIAENIANSIDQSSRTILLLSRNFLNSEWCQYEFQQAHYKVITEGKGRLLVVLMEDIKPGEIKDKTLRTYISTHTYLQSNDRLFWDKLRLSLPKISIANNAQEAVASSQL